MQKHTKYSNTNAAEPPATHVAILNMPTRRLGRLDDGGCGYVLGGMNGAGRGLCCMLAQQYTRLPQYDNAPLHAAIPQFLHHSGPYPSGTDVWLRNPHAGPAET